MTATQDVRAAADRLQSLLSRLPLSARARWHNPEPHDGWNCLVESGVCKLGTFRDKPVAQYVAVVADPAFVAAVVDLLTAVSRSDCEDDDCLSVLSCGEVLAERLPVTSPKAAPKAADHHTSNVAAAGAHARDLAAQELYALPDDQRPLTRDELEREEAS